MRHLLSLSLLLTIAKADPHPDPTQVCLADTTQVLGYNVLHGFYNVEVLDFVHHRLAARAINTAVRYVQDMVNQTEYYVDVHGNCRSKPTSPEFSVTQCLPANAVLLANGSLGLAEYGVQYEAWELPLEAGLRIQFFYIVQDGHYTPFFRTAITSDGDPSMIYVYSDGSHSVSAQGIGDIPAEC